MAFEIVSLFNICNYTAGSLNDAKLGIAINMFTNAWIYNYFQLQPWCTYCDNFLFILPHDKHENTAYIKQIRLWLQILDLYVIASNLTHTVSRSRVFRLWCFPEQEVSRGHVINKLRQTKPVAFLKCNIRETLKHVALIEVMNGLYGYGGVENESSFFSCTILQRLNRTWV